MPFKEPFLVLKFSVVLKIHFCSMKPKAFDENMTSMAVEITLPFR